MPVESVNNNNAGLYALGAATIGAGAGAATAYMTKPFLKDGAPTDEFIKSVGEKMVDESTNVTKEQKIFFKEVAPMYKKIGEVTDVEEYKQISNKMIDACAKAYSDTESLKKALSEGGELSAFINGGKTEAELAKTIEAVNNASNIDEIKQILRKNIDDSIATKGFDTIKKEHSELLKAFKDAGIPMSVDDLGKMSIKEVLKDGNLKNEGALTEEGFNIIKKAAKSIQGKYALIYGGIAATVLGLGTLLLSGKKSAEPEKVEA